MKIRQLLLLAVLGGTVGAGAAGIAYPAFAPAVAWAGAGQTSKNDAHQPGMCDTVTTTAKDALPRMGSRNAWCLRAHSNNSARIKFRLGADASASTGFPLSPGDSYCDPVGDNSAFTGRVSVASSSGTQTFCVLGY